MRWQVVKDGWRGTSFRDSVALAGVVGSRGMIRVLELAVADRSRLSQQGFLNVLSYFAGKGSYCSRQTEYGWICVNSWVWKGHVSWDFSRDDIVSLVGTLEEEASS